MNIADLQLFIRTADTGSITASANQLGTTPAAASAALKRLEKQLETQLFIRSTRQLRITAEGERFLVYCRQALAQLEEGKASLQAMRGRIAGELRMSVPSDLGRNFILPWLDEAMAQHPGLSLQLSISDALSDFYLDRVDVALRYGELEDSSAVAFQIAVVERIVFASPDYISQHGAPTHPNELKQHNCLLYRLGKRVFNHWGLSGKGEQHQVMVRGDRESNDAEVVRRWALAGKGVGFKSSLDLSADLQSGRLIRLLPDYQSEPVGLWLICPSRKQVTPAVLMLRDLLRQHCAEALRQI
ncbi:LysR family transcriptional regulator [Oceanospirillum sediminis]|uniref:LysR family transcriptional regulator n=1 Tax=Oceanospirillum sediminis TaxID=2760088 RepID=A0A839IWW5_9GAMM|nr:LysR family transcriptional regulator [Oceanospirillum sediminis]MBB1489114.1 LysR family transcriptional regulator [Oceanospirillum sediminis]